MFLRSCYRRLRFSAAFSPRLALAQYAAALQTFGFFFLDLAVLFCILRLVGGIHTPEPLPTFFGAGSLYFLGRVIAWLVGLPRQRTSVLVSSTSEATDLGLDDPVDLYSVERSAPPIDNVIPLHDV